VQKAKAAQNTPTPIPSRQNAQQPVIRALEPVSALTREKREEHFRQLMKILTQHIFPAHAEFCPLR